MKGMTLAAVLRLRALPQPRRKYLFDFGRPDATRFSVYLDENDAFTIDLIDMLGQSHSCTTSLPFTQFFRLVFVLTVGDDATALRLFVNEREADNLSLEFAFGFGELELAGGVVGADIEGQNCAAFDLAEVAIFSAAKSLQELEPFQKEPLTKYVEFNGSQWMRRESSGNLTQGLRSAAPRFINLRT